MGKKAWENDRFAAYYMATTLYATAETTLTNKQHFSDERPFNVIIDEAEEETDAQEMRSVMQEFDGYQADGRDSSAGTVTGENAFAKAGRIAGTEEAAKQIFQKGDEISAALTAEAAKRGDPKIKRYYEDMAFVTDRKNGNFTQMQMTSPYMKNVFDTMVELTNPGREGSREEKDMLGKPLYEASYDFSHAIADEVRTNYRAQQLDKEGWNPEKERQYLGELHQTHEKLLNAYDHLNTFTDDPQNQTGRLFGNKLSHLFGRGEDENRHVNAYIGMIRGEKQAIENGWGKDELMVLGAIGSIEENVKKHAQYASAADKEGMEQFQADFAKLKNACYHTRVDSAEGKLAIADQVKTFIDTHDSPFAKRAMVSVKNSRASFDRAHDQIREAAERERTMEVKPGDLKKNDPIGYLKGLEQEAERSGDFRRYAQEYADIQGAAMQGVDKKRLRDLDAYGDEIAQKSPEFIENLQREVNQYADKCNIAYGQASEQLAKDIREGREPVDPAFEGIRTDYTASKRIANRMLEGGELDKLVQGSGGLKSNLGMMLANFEQMGQFSQDYQKKATDGLSAAERKGYLTEANLGYSAELADYGVTFKNDERYTVAHGPQNQEVLESLQRAEKKTGKYVEDFTKMTSAAKEKLAALDQLKRQRPTATWKSGRPGNYYVDEKGNRVDPKKCNSQSFMNMYNALKDVSNLSPDSSPKQVQDALGRLGAASKAYHDKLESQTFSAWSKNGRERRGFSTDLQSFAKGQGERLAESATGFVSPNESILEQANRVQANLKAIKARMKENQAGNAPAQAPQEKKQGGHVRSMSVDDLGKKLGVTPPKPKPHHERKSVPMKSAPVKEGPGMGKQ